MFVNIALVGIGGFLGAICRYLGNLAVTKTGFLAGLPLGTLLVNLTGCFLIGFLAYWGESREIFPQNIRLFLFSGFLGAFTTFSSFGHETVTLVRQQMLFWAMANVVVHVVLGLLFVCIGLGLARLFFK